MTPQDSPEGWSWQKEWFRWKNLDVVILRCWASLLVTGSVFHTHTTWNSCHRLYATHQSSPVQISFSIKLVKSGILPNVPLQRWKTCVSNSVNLWCNILVWLKILAFHAFLLISLRTCNNHHVRQSSHSFKTLQTIFAILVTNLYFILKCTNNFTYSKHTVFLFPIQLIKRIHSCPSDSHLLCHSLENKLPFNKNYPDFDLLCVKVLL